MHQVNYIQRFGTGNSFRVDIGAPQDKTPNYHELAKQLAQEIYDNKQGTLYIMYSGGADSEYVLNVFLELGLDVTPVIIQLNPGYNEHDVKYAFDFCQSKGLTPLVVDLDFNTFVTSGLIRDIGEEFKVATYQLPTTFHVVGQLDGTVVMGSHSVPHITKKANGWYLNEYEPIWTALEYFTAKGIHGCPFFLVQTPEMYYGLLNHPIMHDLANDLIPGKLGNNSSKIQIFNSLSEYKYQIKQRPKYTGYEHIEECDIFQHENMQWFNNVAMQWWGIHSEPYFPLIERLRK
jgi:hypothetical protein